MNKTYKIILSELKEQIYNGCILGIEYNNISVKFTDNTIIEITVIQKDINILLRRDIEDYNNIKDIAKSVIKFIDRDLK